MSSRRLREPLDALLERGRRRRLPNRSAEKRSTPLTTRRVLSLCSALLERPATANGIKELATARIQLNTTVRSLSSRGTKSVSVHDCGRVQSNA